jgi:hypothetical protein
MFMMMVMMSKSTATDLNKIREPTQYRLPCELKNALTLPGGCCCLNDTGNKILFRINWRAVSQRYPATLLRRRSRSVGEAPGMQAT